MKILLTGASGDIGSVISETLEREFEVYKLTSEILDLSVEQEVDSWIELNQNLSFDVIILCAGINFPRNLINFESSSFSSTFQVNFANQIKIALKDRKSTRLNSSHIPLSRMPSSA